MTTIAYKDGVMAGDRRVTSNRGVIVGSTTKVRRIGPLLFGASGSTVATQRIESWVVAGMKGDHPTLPDDDETEAIIVWGRHIVSINREGLDRITADQYALGSGFRIALGAMAAGASAEEAVRIASTLDVNTGPEIDVIRRSQP